MVLDDILERKRKEVEELKKKTSLTQLIKDAENYKATADRSNRRFLKARNRILSVNLKKRHPQKEFCGNLLMCNK